jgi:hypothetical protein
MDLPCRTGILGGAYFGGLPAANDGLVLVLLQKLGQANNTQSGDIALQGYLTLYDMLNNGGNVECTAANYTRKQITSGATVVWTGGNSARFDCYFPAQTLLNLGNPQQLQQVQKLVICYWPNVGFGGDAAIQPLAHADYFHACDGTSFALDMPQGYLRPSGAAV